MDSTGPPGAALVEDWLGDLARGVATVPSLLVSIGSPRLRLLGFGVPPAPPDAERGLYELLEKGDPDSAHGRYNAFVRTLVSFERAAALRRRAAAALTGR